MKLLKDDGWEIVRVKGSHHQLRHPVKKGLVTIPHLKKRFPSAYYCENLKRNWIKELIALMKKVGILC